MKHSYDTFEIIRMAAIAKAAETFLNPNDNPKENLKTVEIKFVEWAAKYYDTTMKRLGATMFLGQ